MINPVDVITLIRLRKNLRQPISKLNIIQHRRLQDMVQYAYDNVRYYRKLFESAGVNPRDIRTPEDLHRIPISNREQIQNLSAEDIVSAKINLRKCKRITTGGSSGIPLVVFIRQRDNDFNDLVWARTSLENGKRLQDTTVYLKFHFPPRMWFEKLGIWKKEIISLSEPPQKKIERLIRLKPDIIRGNPFELRFLAEIIKQQKIKGIKPRIIFCMGSLLDQSSRELLQSVFQAEVFDFYGTTELGCVAWECSMHRGYHVNMDTVVVEIIKDGKKARPGEPGNVVCTGLISRAMPFIRYDTGDIAVASEEVCHCGRNLPLLHSLEGRADDFFISPGGNLVSPSQIVNRVKLIKGIVRFRIIQEQERLIRAEVVSNPEFSRDIVQKFSETLIEIMGNGIRVEVDIVDSIPDDSSGKIRSLISKVKKEF